MAELNLSFIIPLMLLVIIALAEVSREVNIRQLSVGVHDQVYLLHGGPFEPLFRKMDRTPQIATEAIADYFSWDDNNSSSESTSKSEIEEPDPNSEPSPTLGRFNHLHGFNTFLLTIAMILIALARADLSGFLLALVVTVFWMNLPAIETNEYDQMLQMFRPGDPLHSLSFHTFTVGVSALPLLILSAVDIGPYPPLAKVIGAGVYILWNIYVSNQYLSFLDNELQLIASLENGEVD